MSKLGPTLWMLVLLALFGLCAWWLWQRVRQGTHPETLATATPTIEIPNTPEPTPSPLPAPPGYRLAGVAIGGAMAYAVVEAPSGRSSLYHVDEDVPGLGRLALVEAERIVIAAPAGQFVLWVARAPSPTRTVIAEPPHTTPTPRQAGAAPTRE